MSLKENKSVSILHILHSELGGTASVVFPILNLKSNYKDIILLSGPSLSNNYYNFLKKKKIFFKFIKVKKNFFIFSYHKIFSFLKASKPKIIFIHNYQIIAPIFYSFFYNTSIIYVDHKANNLKIFKDKFSIFLMKFFAKKIVTVNKTNFLLLKKKTNKAEYIPNPVNNIFFRKKIINNKKILFKIGMASRINSLKLHSLIIDFFKLNSKKNLKIICEFAGEGELKKDLQDYIKKNNLTSKIKFIGELSETKMKKWFSDINLYIQATKGEGMATAVLQALASGVPTLASKVEGNKEIINEKKFIGKFFNNNVQDLSRKILYFYQLNNKSKKKFIQQGINYIKKNHTTDLIKKKYFNLIKNLITETF